MSHNLLSLVNIWCIFTSFLRRCVNKFWKNLIRFFILRSRSWRKKIKKKWRNLFPCFIPTCIKATESALLPLPILKTASFQSGAKRSFNCMGTLQVGSRILVIKSSLPRLLLWWSFYQRKSLMSSILWPVILSVTSAQMHLELDEYKWNTF